MQLRVALTAALALLLAGCAFQWHPGEPVQFSWSRAHPIDVVAWQVEHTSLGRCDDVSGIEVWSDRVSHGWAAHTICPDHDALAADVTAALNEAGISAVQVQAIVFVQGAPRCQDRRLANACTNGSTVLARARAKSKDLEPELAAVFAQVPEKRLLGYAAQRGER